MQFNNKLAVLLVVLIFLFLAAGAWFDWDNKVSDIATGALITILTLVAQFYFRRAPAETPTGTTTITTENQSTLTATASPPADLPKDAPGS